MDLDARYNSVAAQLGRVHMQLKALAARRDELEADLEALLRIAKDAHAAVPATLDAATDRPA